MRRQKTVLIGEVFKDYLKETGLEQGVLRMDVFKAWDSVVGEKFKEYTLDKYFKNGRLICRISSSSAKTQLFMNRIVITQRVNEILGAEVVKTLILK
ncbi:MAG: DUF721 domain-containing protein [Bacteroidales bacterium]|nr:DUF721 domain-containing protein [Bacteroidales bacterium]